MYISDATRLAVARDAGFKINMIKLWLDDHRLMPDDFNVWAKDATSAIAIIKTGRVSHISLDHDLGTELSGYDVAKVIEELAFLGKIPKMIWAVHSQNPSGRDNIIAAMESADRFWSKT